MPKHKHKNTYTDTRGFGEYRPSPMSCKVRVGKAHAPLDKMAALGNAHSSAGGGLGGNFGQKKQRSCCLRNGCKFPNTQPVEPSSAQLKRKAARHVGQNSQARLQQHRHWTPWTLKESRIHKNGTFVIAAFNLPASEFVVSFSGTRGSRRPSACNC